MSGLPWGLRARLCMLVLLAAGLCPLWATAQTRPPGVATAQAPPSFRGETTDEYNQRLKELEGRLGGLVQGSPVEDYRIGAEDLLEISVFEAPELKRTVRVAASGEVSLPLLGIVQAAGLTARELEVVLQELLRRTYMKDPHVGVFVREMQSHPVSVFGAVRKPGVFQIRGAKTLVEVLSMAGGIADDAGDSVIVMRGAGLPEAADPPSARPVATGILQNHSSKDVTDAAAGKTVEIDVKNLLQSGDSHSNVLIYPGDVVKVTRAGVVYVVGEVRKPGGFVLKTNENVSVLQALALAEGLTRTSAKSRAQIIRTDEVTGARSEIPINLGKILSGKAADPLLKPKDIVFVPNSAGRTALYRGAEAAIGIGSSLIIYRR
jgi:polysaccharide biosynthesis/export protein